ncbi:MAG TPA: MscL family protein, partial [Candidatus Thermoplasmatota archaeon]|nr:MscL family protein [Candidatus Thermoplasmatota archaeon]
VFAAPMTTVPASAPAPRLSLFQEFRAFLDKYGVVGLAIAFVIGAALTTLVKAVVDDVLMPIVALITPSGGWEDAKFTYPALPDGWDRPKQGLPPHTLEISWGHLLGTIINFVIIALFVFVVAKYLLRQQEIKKI